MTAERKTAASPDVGHEPHLQGRMGVLETAFTVLAFAAPLTGTWGYLPLIIIFAGIGAPLVIVLAMILLLIFSVGFVKMSRSIENPGAFYAFVSVGINRSVGLSGAFLATVAYLLLSAGIVSFFGLVASGLIADQFGGPSISWYWLTLAVMVVVSVFGFFGIEVSAKTLSLVLVVEVALVLAFDLAVFAKNGPDGRSLEPFSISALSDGNLALGVLFAVVMFLGFEATAIFREEARDPDRTIPRATYLSVGFIGVFYALTLWLIIVGTGIGASPEVAASDPAGMVPNAFDSYLGGATKDVATVLVLTSVFASSLAIHNVFARYLYNLGVDGAFPRALGSVHPQQGSPHIASATSTVVTGLIILLVVMFNQDPGTFYARAAGVGTLCIMVLMVLTMVGVVLYFRRNPAQDDSTWATLVAPSVAGIGLGVVVVLAFKNANAFMGTTTDLSIIFSSLIGVLFVVGLIVAQRMKNTRPEVYERLGRQ